MLILNFIYTYKRVHHVSIISRYKSDSFKYVNAVK